MAILLVGASVRALAESAVSAGEEVIAADLFSDQDLQAIARVTHILPMENYPDSITSISARYPGLARCYTGGLENRPVILQSLAADGPLWGNNAEVVQPVRDPFQLHDFLDRLGFDVPAIRRHDHPPATTEGWLVKPNRGTGGTHIRLAGNKSASANEHFQQIEQGIPCSALFVGRKDESPLIGVSRQVLAGETTGPLGIPSPYAYVGSIGPLPSDSARDSILGSLAQALVTEFKLRGFFGIDFLWDQKRVVIIEINPRYPASAEVFEIARQSSLFPLHRAVFTDARLDIAKLPSARHAIGKLIFFAPEDGRLTQPLPTLASGGGTLWCSDIPPIGRSFKKGEPVATMLMKADTSSALPIWPAEQSEQLWRDYFSLL